MLPSGRSGLPSDLRSLGRMRCVLRPGVEACHRSHHHGLAVVGEFLEEPLGELVAVIHGEAHCCVESAHGGRTEDSGDGSEGLYEVVSSLDVLFLHGLEVGLGSVEGGLSGYLSVCGGAEAGL